MKKYKVVRVRSLSFELFFLWRWRRGLSKSYFPQVRGLILVDFTPIFDIITMSNI